MAETRTPKLLVVDDEADVCEILQRWIVAGGYECLTAPSGEAAVALLETRDDIDLVITDIMMPGMSGVDLLTFIKSWLPDTGVIMVTAVDDQQTALLTFELGAWGYILKPFEAQSVMLNIANALERRRLLLHRKSVEQTLQDRLDQALNDLRTRDESLCNTLLAALHAKHDETPTHSRRIGHYAALIARFLRWEPEDVEMIRLASPLHDIGKIGIPDSILLKPDNLSPEEQELIKKHTVIGADILNGSSLPVIRMAREIAQSHHEQWNGAGFPNRLKGENIPESARIVAIVDAYDTLTHRRGCRPGLSDERAVKVMTAYHGQAFDPRIFQYFLTLLPQIREIRRQVGE